MPKGLKICKECGAENGVRSFKCRDCDTEFAFNTKSNCNWKELKEGDVIRVTGGPYWLCKPDEQGERERINMGSHGLFRVIKPVDKGLMCRSGKKYRHEFTFIYMGPDGIDPCTGTVLRTHRVRKIVPRKRRKKKYDV